MANKIVIFRGDTPTFSVTITDKAGAAFDLTDYTIKMTVKQNDSDSSHKIQVTGSASQPTTGVATITMSANHTNIPPGEYVYDIQISKDVNNVYTVVKETFTVNPDITTGYS